MTDPQPQEIPQTNANPPIYFLPTFLGITLPPPPTSPTPASRWFNTAGFPSQTRPTSKLTTTPTPNTRTLAESPSDIHKIDSKTCYGQWADAGPFGEADAPYVFGDQPPICTINSNAGLDLSPTLVLCIGMCIKLCCSGS